MKVWIDYELCMGDKNCNKVCPEAFIVMESSEA